MRTTLTLTRIVEEWLSELDASEDTVLDYRRKLLLWFRWLAARGIDTRSPHREHILQYRNHLKDEGKSRFTFFSYMAVVKLFYKYCSERNYCEDIGLGISTSIRQREHCRDPLSAEDAQRLLTSIGTDTITGKRDRLIVALMLTNGLRSCEVQRIDIGDIEQRGNHTLLHIQRKGRTDKNELLALPEMVVWMLNEYLECREDDTAAPLIVNHCRGQKPTRLSRQSISQMVKERLRAIGIDDPKVTAHSLRHTCGSLLVEMGMDIETVKDLLGHSSTKTTRIYIEQAQRKRLIEQNPGEKIAKLILTPSKTDDNLNMLE